MGLWNRYKRVREEEKRKKGEEPLTVDPDELDDLEDAGDALEREAREERDRKRRGR